MNQAGVSTNPKEYGPLRRKWLMTIVRVLAFIFMLFCVGLFIVGTYEYKQFAESHLKEIAPYSWTAQEFEHFLGQIKWTLSDWIQLNQAVAIIVAFIFCGVGFLIFYRKGYDWFGLYIATIFVLYGSLSGAAWTGFTGAHPDWDWLLIPLGTYPWFALFSLFYLFPDGHFVPRWTRWPFLILFLFFLFVIFVNQGNQPPPGWLAVAFGLIAIGVGSQIYRYRKVSNGLQRQQTKWILFSFGITFTILVTLLLPLIFPDQIAQDSSTIQFWVVYSTFGGIIVSSVPLSVAFAVFRYRLWDIDLIIRRTLVYGVLSSILGLVYFGSVVLLRQLLGGVVGDSSIAIVLSTLLIAALFSPLRRALQGGIDRRFFRRKYDAVRALAEFSAVARDEVQLEAISNKLVAVVGETIQPESLSLWMRPQIDRRRKGSS